MKTNISRSKRHAILLDGMHVRNIFAFLKSKYDTVELSATCRDGSQLVADTAEEIIEFENPTFRSIQQLSVLARTGFENRASVHIEDAIFRTATISVTSESDLTAVGVATELEQRLLDSRPWYSLLARLNIVYTVFLLWGAWGLAETSRRMLDGTLTTSGASKLPVVEQFNVAALFALILFCITFLLDKLRLWLFPRVFFSIGRQRDQLEARKKWRWWILTALILAPLVKWGAAVVLK